MGVVGSGADTAAGDAAMADDDCGRWADARFALVDAAAEGGVSGGGNSRI